MGVPSSAVGQQSAGASVATSEPNATYESAATHEAAAELAAAYELQPTAAQSEPSAEVVSQPAPAYLPEVMSAQHPGSYLPAPEVQASPAEPAPLPEVAPLAPFRMQPEVRHEAAIMLPVVADVRERVAVPVSDDSTRATYTLLGGGTFTWIPAERPPIATPQRVAAPPAGQSPAAVQPVTAQAGFSTTGQWPGRNA
ncbi:MAG: hypothetical protein LH650_01595 [Chloroflexi bacterium]|nr:hypothetical protein [Chloroflexota bacterium]